MAKKLIQFAAYIAVLRRFKAEHSFRDPGQSDISDHIFCLTAQSFS
jgi:hypothetical protein